MTTPTVERVRDKHLKTAVQAPRQDLPRQALKLLRWSKARVRFIERFRKWYNAVRK